MKHYPKVDLPDICGDVGIALNVLEEILPRLMEKYGKHAVMIFDAGANNVQVQMIPTRAQKVREDTGSK